jgi:hypothetical protein
MKGLGAPRRAARRLTYANVVATLALVIAISGGTAYAAAQLIKGSQIARGTITASNIKKATLTTNLFARGALKVGPRGATGAPGAPGAAGAPGSAVAYGDIQMNASGNPYFNSALSKGFTTIFSPSVGVLCIAYPAGVSTNLPLSINPAGGEPDVWEQYSPAQCGGTGFEIANATASRNLSGELEVSVP